MESEFSKLYSYNGYSGVDMTAYTSTTPRKKIGNVQAISISTDYCGTILFCEDFDCPEEHVGFEVEILEAGPDGKLSNMHVIGIEILEEGYYVKTAEAWKGYTYIARGIRPWRDKE